MCGYSLLFFFYSAEIATNQIEIGIARDLVEIELEREKVIEIAMTVNERETGGTTTARRWKAVRETETERGGRERATEGEEEEGGGEEMTTEERGVVPAMVGEGREVKEVGGQEGVAEDTVSSNTYCNDTIIILFCLLLAKYLWKEF